MSALSPANGITNPFAGAADDEAVVVVGGEEDDEDEWVVVVPRVKKAKFSISADEWDLAPTEKRSRFCVWGMGHLSKKDFFHFVDLAFGAHRACVLKVRQVSQHDGQARFDMFLVHESMVVVNSCMLKLSSFFNAHVRAHIPYSLRTHASPVSAYALDSLSVISLNTNGLAKKKEEIAFFLSQVGVDVALLQETHRAPEQVNLKPIWLQGYNVVEIGEAGAGNARGLAVAVRNGILSRHLGWASSSAHCAAVEVRCASTTVIFVCVYIPCTQRKEGMAALRKCLLVIAARRPNAAVVVGGDFNAVASNTNVIALCEATSMAPIPFTVASPITYYHGLSPKSAIDFFTTNTAAQSLVSKVSVLQEWSLSDHKPIAVSVYVGGKVTGMKKGGVPKMDVKVLAEKKEAILGSNYWAPLLTLSSQLDGPQAVESVVETLLDSSRKLATELDCLKATACGKKAVRVLTRKTRNAIMTKHALALSLSSSLQVSEDDKKRYESARNLAKRCVRADKRRSWDRFVVEGVAKRREHQKEYWGWLRAVTNGAKRASATLPAVVPASGEEPVFAEEEVVAAFSEYYKVLCADPALEGKDQQYWAAALAHLPQQTSLGVDGPLIWSEVVAVLAYVRPSKAAGPSGIQSCWWQLATEGAASTAPSTDLGKVMFNCLSGMWEHGVVPESLRTSLLVSIFKKGDSMDMGNYRGISLCETLLKLLTAIVANRLQSALNATGRIRSEQAGFRRGEECMGHVAALLEICSRRLAQDEATVVGFLDLKKAFDVVPTLALLEKVKKVGVEGRALAFISALYTATSVAVRKNDGTAGPSIQVERGVRQGCPLSPILFDVFINDLLDECAGVIVPGMGERVPGLLYADDTALVSEDAEAMQVALDQVQAWAELNGMQFGISKCGVMVVGGDMEVLEEAGLNINGQLLPVVESYCYLGFPFFCTLDLFTAVEAREEKVKSSVGACHNFLRSRSIPVVAKIDVLRSKIFPALCYAGEVLGMNQNRVQKLESLWTSCVRGITAGAGNCGAEVLLRELGLFRVHAAMSAASARALAKYPTLATTISALSTRTAESIWAKTAHTWLARLHVSTDSADITADVRVAVQQRQWATALKNRKGAQAFEACGFTNTSSYVSHFCRKLATAGLDEGFKQLLAARCGGIWTAERRARHGIDGSDPSWLTSCPFCDRSEPETLIHLLLCCKAWRKERRSLLQPVLVAVRSVPTYSSKVTLLLGGVVNGEVLTGWIDGSTNPLYVSVVRFLQAISGRRRYLLFCAESNESPSPSGYGSPGAHGVG